MVSRYDHQRCRAHTALEGPGRHPMPRRRQSCRDRAEAMSQLWQAWSTRPPLDLQQLIVVGGRRANTRAARSHLCQPSGRDASNCGSLTWSTREREVTRGKGPAAIVLVFGAWANWLGRFHPVVNRPSRMPSQRSRLSLRTFVIRKTYDRLREAHRFFTGGRYWRAMRALVIAVVHIGAETGGEWHGVTSVVVTRPRFQPLVGKQFRRES
jgi:hypothetical protein